MTEKPEQKLLREARQYVADAGGDECPEAQRHSTALLAEIDAALSSQRRRPTVDDMARARELLLDMGFYPDPDNNHWRDLERKIAAALAEARAEAQASCLRVTKEMIAAGSQAIDDYYNGTKDAPFEGSVEACYRAMRALEPRC